MLTAVAPNYANLFMDRLETKALDGWPLKTHYLAQIYR